MIMYNKDEIKNSLTTEQVEQFVADLGGEPLPSHNGLICRTICHGGDSHKLYYYSQSRLFKCFTQCQDSSFDIFDLTMRVKKRENPSFTFADAIRYVAHYFGISDENPYDFESFQLKDWEIFDKMKIEALDIQKLSNLPIYDDKVLKHLPTPVIEPWLREGISKETMRDAGIRYDPVTDSIIIPHFDINGNLIGIRKRTLIKEEEKYGKYIPAVLNGKMYNHPLSFNLYNLNCSKDNIISTGTVIVFESEKSTLMYKTYFGKENDISVACCGSNLVVHQAELLKKLGVKEIIIAFDKQWQTVGDEEYKRWTKKLEEIHHKYYKDFLISFIFDKDNKYLGYKDSPIDKGGEVFLELFKERIYL